MSQLDPKIFQLWDSNDLSFPGRILRYHFQQQHSGPGNLVIQCQLSDSRWLRKNKESIKIIFDPNQLKAIA
jgi:hypothetical protein